MLDVCFSFILKYALRTTYNTTVIRRIFSIDEKNLYASAIGVMVRPFYISSGSMINLWWTRAQC